MIFFASGDAPFLFEEQIRQFSWLPPVWDTTKGFGQSLLPRLWLEYPYRFVLKILSLLGFSWFFIDKLFWIIAFVLAVYSSYRLVRRCVNRPLFAVLGSVIYTTNTYFLLLFSGGQLGVAWAFAFLPLVFLKFTEGIDTPVQQNIRTSIGNGLYFALLIVLDIRLAYLAVIAIGLYFFLHWYLYGSKYIGTIIISTFIVPGIIGLCSHAFWILPTVFGGGGIQSLGDQFTSPGMLKFLSSADFSHALSLLHPNWPENLFGKVYFLQPEFLILPLLAFCAFLFVEKKAADRSRKIFFFGVLALLGVFLAKGVNDPFGEIFQWMFIHIPGFVMFRDPTKVYVFTALGYSVLIPYTLQRLTEKIHINEILIWTIFLLYWCFTIRPVFLGQMRGNFLPPRISADYVRLKDVLVGDAKPSRTLWIPQNDPFAYTSEVHPLLTSNELFNGASISAVIAMIKTPEFMKSLADSGVGYVIVPTDLTKQFFLTDYRFNPDERSLLIDALKNTTLIEDTDFTGVAVFKNTQFTMISTIPPIVARQQILANIGVGISSITLVSSAVILILKRRK